jgi:hypothetical protein
MVLALSSALIISGLVWALIARYVSSHRARLYEDPITNIQSIRISPGNNFSLIGHDIEITDAVTLQAIMTSIRSANKYSPNHPATQWSCTLTIFSLSGASFVGVIETYGQGTILQCTTSPNGGFIFDTLQSGTMGQILEARILKNGSH